MKKYFYIIIASIIILLVTLIIVLLVYNNKISNNNTVVNGTGTVPGENMSFELNGKIFPEDYSEFQQKTKNKKIDYHRVYELIYNLVRGGEQLKKDTASMSEDDLKKYFNKNTELCYEKGIRTETDFVKIVNLLRLVYSGNGEVFYNNVKIIVDSNRENTYEIDIQYTNGKIIRLNFVIVNASKLEYKFVPIQ